MLGRRPFLPYVTLLLVIVFSQPYDAVQNEKLERLHRLEGEAIIALADAALAGHAVPAGFTISWHNDVLKAQQGTFVPFVVTIDPVSPAPSAILLYVRLIERSKPARLSEADAARRAGRSDTARREEEAVVPSGVEEVYPIDLRLAPPGPIRITRGVAARPGEYDLVVVARERVDAVNPSAPRRAGTVTKRLILPDFTDAELTASSVMLADRLTVLPALPPDERPGERPYLIGLSEIQPATDNVFRRDEELIVVFLVYNPAVTREGKFDIEVEYHFFTKTGNGRAGEQEIPAGGTRPPAREGERYFNQTKPQRFTPATMGPDFDPTAGQPLMAGQGVPLAAFPEGEYRLSITVTDIVTSKTIVRDVSFSVVSRPERVAG